MRDLPQEALGRMLLESAALGTGYVAVPRLLLGEVEGQAYPPSLLDEPWCAMTAGTGGWNRTYAVQVDLLCVLRPEHDGDHGWEPCADMPPEACSHAGALA